MEEPRQKKMAIIASKGTLDMAYPPFILATTAAALGWEVQIFFTFYGLQLLRKSLKKIKISPLANPAMPMPVPMPVLLGSMPGMQSMATTMMKTATTTGKWKPTNKGRVRNRCTSAFQRLTRKHDRSG